MHPLRVERTLSYSTIKKRKDELDNSTYAFTKRQNIFNYRCKCGLWFETTKAPAKKDARVIKTTRSLNKGREAGDTIKKEVPGADLVLMQLDLANLASVQKFAADFTNRFSQLDVLLNNAGVMMPVNREKTKQGFELQFGTNHIGHFLLTQLILPILEAATNSRIVTLSSYFTGRLHLSPSYFSELLKKETGKTAQDFLHNELIRKGKTLLLKSNAGVSEIAYLPGFENPPYFTRLFKIKTGMTPSEFRQLAN